MSNQPVWKLVANLGDKHPLDYGGLFVYRDETGVYPEEAELLVLDNESDENTTYTVYRFTPEQCTLTDGILSDNKYHPEHPAWFAHPEKDKAKRPQDSTYLSCVASYVGSTVEKMQEDFCSPDPCVRTMAYRAVGDYHGWENLDSYPLLNLSRKEAEERYAEKNG